MQEVGPRLPSEIKESELHRVIEAIKVKGKKSRVKAINNEAKMNNQKLRQILRFLQETGEYDGFGNATNQPKT